MPQPVDFLVVESEELESLVIFFFDSLVELLNPLFSDFLLPPQPPDEEDGIFGVELLLLEPQPLEPEPELLLLELEERLPELQPLELRPELELEPDPRLLKGRAASGSANIAMVNTDTTNRFLIFIFLIYIRHVVLLSTLMTLEIFFREVNYFL